MIHPKEAGPFLATADARSLDLAERIVGQIERRACGRIRDLRVVCEQGQIILKGHSQTYHAKQLALQAALDFSDSGEIHADMIVVS